MIQTILLLIISVFTTVSAQLFIKKGVLGLGKPDLSFFGFLALISKVLQSVWMMAGLVLFGISFLLWILILSRIQLNIAYSVVFSLNFSLITILSWFLFGEYLSPVQILGIVIIIFGIFLLSRGL